MLPTAGSYWDSQPNTQALRGSWHHEVPEEPMHLAEEFKEVPCALTASRARGDPPVGQLGPDTDVQIPGRDQPRVCAWKAGVF